MGEVGPYETVLERGYAMASVYPAVHYHDRTTPLTDGLRKTLNGCKNPLGSPLGSAVSEWPSLSTVGFVKFGGEPWRASFFSDAYAACPSSNPTPNPDPYHNPNPNPNPNPDLPPHQVHGAGQSRYPAQARYPRLP